MPFMCNTYQHVCLLYILTSAGCCTLKTLVETFFVEKHIYNILSIIKMYRNKTFIRKIVAYLF